MAWQLIAAQAAPYIAKGIGQALNKPKEEDFTPQTKYMEKYLSHLKGITTNREAQHLAMQPALRTIGAESRKTKQELGYQAEKTGVAGSGIEAQMKLSAGQGTQQALAQASATAAANQAAINRRTGEQIAGVSAGIEQEQERAAEAFKQAKKDWKQENIQLGLEAASSLAGAGLQSSYQTGQAKAIAEAKMSPEKIQQLRDMGMDWTGVAKEAEAEWQRYDQMDEFFAKKGIPIPDRQYGGGAAGSYDEAIKKAEEQGYWLGYGDDPNLSMTTEGTTAPPEIATEVVTPEPTVADPEVEVTPTVEKSIPEQIEAEESDVEMRNKRNVEAPQELKGYFTDSRVDISEFDKWFAQNPNATIQDQEAFLKAMIGRKK